MIPIRLEFEGFGPFPKKQTIDFTQFDNDRLFLITGKTGSGKTTIFDAVAFSLYGQASGQIRQTDSFKSDFSDDSTVCYVEFEFVIHNKQYIIRREPIQYKLKRNGNLVRKNSTALLTLENGEMISGTQAVDSKIEEIIGINADQFKKIVMLPQGEFRRFLTDDSVEKQKTLRKIFSTKILDDFTDQLKQNAFDLKHETEQYHQICNAYVESIQTDDETLQNEKSKEFKNIETILALLNDYNDHLKKETEKLKSELNTVNSKKEKLNLPYYKEINNKFNLLNQAKSELLQLDEKKEHYLNLHEKINKLKSIKDLYSLYEVISDLKTNFKNTQDNLVIQKDMLSKNNSELNQMNKIYLTLKNEYNKIPEIVKEIESLKNLYETVCQIENSNQQLEKIYTDNQKLNTMKQSFIQCKNRLLLLKQVDEKNNRLHLLSSLKQEITVCGEYSSVYIKENQSYRTKMQDFLDAQAYFLSGKLSENTPCPVCGSTNHPIPAIKPQTVVTQQELEKAKLNYETITKKLKEQQGICKQLLMNAGFDISSHDRLSLFLDEIDHEIKTLQLEINQLNEEINHIKVDYSLLSFNQIELLDEKLNSVITSIAVNNQQIETLNKTIDEAKQKLNNKMFAKDDIKKNCNLLNEKILKMKAEYEDTSTKKEKITAQNNRLNESVLLITSQIKQMENTISEKDIQFKAALEKSSISYEEFLNQKNDLLKLNDYEKDLSSFKEKYAEKKGIVQSLSTQLEGISPINLDVLQHEYDELSAEILTLNEKYTSTLSRYHTNKEIYQKLNKGYQQFFELSKKQAEYQKIYDIANGKFSDKLNFERYVLASYFNEVIKNANIRLEQMTNQRYTLNRRTEKEKGLKASGLELEVFDAHTGKARHVNTLSGGESFKIALSLALGLADIISQNSGGIELNTMFIDEGFGSLDSNSLDNAIECLNDIRNSGRYIGIISHVNELKEKIPSKIIVHQETTGSYIDIN